MNQFLDEKRYVYGGIMKKRNRKYVMTLFLTAALLLGGCQSAAADKKQEEAAAAQETNEVKVETRQTQFGEFVTTTIDGTEVTQDIFADAKLTMVNIWATYCSPCISEMPHLQEISEEYAEKGVAIVGIISDAYEAKDENAVEVIELTGVRYPQLIHSEALYDNFLHLVQAVPTTVFVDENGYRVGDVIMGAKDKDAWIAEIETRLEALTDDQE